MFISRQKAVLTAALSLAVGISPTGARADISTIIDDEKLIFTLHTHLYSSSKGLPSSDEFQTAAVCFISDTSDCSDYNTNEKNPDYNLNDAERCRKEGYGLSSCAEGEIPEGFCIYNSNYFARCVCPSGYKTCEAPYYGVGAACGNKYASCEEDTERACKELNYKFTNTCQTGWKIDPNNTCKYDTAYGTCCNLCSGYDYTTIPEGYVQDGDTCTDCNGTIKYKIKINPCEGFQDCGNLGPVFGTETCLSGTTTLYKECNTCPNIGKYQSSSPECSAPFKCSYEDCSGKYYQSGCVEGFTWNETAKACTCEGIDWCAITSSCTDLGYKQQTCNGSSIKCPFNVDYSFCTGECSPLFPYTCTGTNEVGGAGYACGGKYTECTCQNGYAWNGMGCVSICEEGTELGYILYSDMTRSAELNKNKTPIGVVVCSYLNGGGQAMALVSLSGTYTWGEYGTNISSLKDYESRNQAATDFASCENSTQIRAQGDSSTYPAVWAAYNYSTAGTSAGDWCLPAAGIFTSIYNNQSTINTGFIRAGGTQFTSSTYAWSSSESSEYNAWVSTFRYNYGLSWHSKIYNNHAVRPIIEF